MMKIGILGMGLIGFNHAKEIVNGFAGECVLHSVCVRSKDTAENVSKEFGPDIKILFDIQSFLSDPELNGVIICTPHYDHPEHCIAAFQKNLHVLSEKPTGVFTRHVEELNAFAEKSKKSFSAMFNMRCKPIWLKVKDILINDEIGKLKRLHWVMAESYRTQAYYDLNEWRGTWQGEGGGVLLNQCSHHLDLLQWFVGMPDRVRSFCQFGAYRNIEVEDNVTAYLEYKNGFSATITATTGESPGSSRLEIIGDTGKLIVESGEITLYKNEIGETEFNKSNTSPWGSIKHTVETITFPQSLHSHGEVIKNWVENIKDGTPLLVPGNEGVNSLAISNAIYLSTWNDAWVTLPIDAIEYEKQLKSRF